MGIDTLTHRNDGSRVATPVSHDDWRQWVSAGQTRNWMLNDPLIDWLRLYGRSCGYVPRQELAGYAKELDFVEFIFEKGRAFEAGILRLLQEKYEVTTIARGCEDVRELDKAEETFSAMVKSVPIIFQAVLWDAQNLNYGSPDFLVRSDVLRQLFPDSISEQEVAVPAPDLGNNKWHYRVVDTKFTTIHLNSTGTELANDGSGPAYKAQLYVYNRMLGRLQGFEPPESYLLGRRWQLTSKGVTYRGTSITTTASRRDSWAFPASGGTPLLMRAPRSFVAPLDVLKPSQQLTRPEPLPGQHLPHHPAHLGARDLGHLFPPSPAAGSAETPRPAGTG